MTWLPIPPEKLKYEYAKARYFDREHGTEYLKFELQQMKTFHNTRNLQMVEVTGYVSTLPQGQFLLLPSKTAWHGYILCEISDGIDYPPNNQYISVKGKWRYSPIKHTAFANKILIVDDIQTSSPDFGIIKPDISYNDFEGILFERWINVAESTKKLIAQNLISSPPYHRAGGLTLSLFNQAKQLRVHHFMSDLRRLIPNEIMKNKHNLIEVMELGLKHKLSPLGWSGYISDFENVNSETRPKLDRLTHMNEEYFISLLSEQSSPSDFSHEGLVKSDYPIVLEEHIERKSASYDASQEIYKYLMAVHMFSPVISNEVYKEGIKYSENTLHKKIKTNEFMLKLTGKNQLIDLDMDGKPLSILNLTSSYGRSGLRDIVSLEDVKNVTDSYLNNLEYVVETWNERLENPIPVQAGLNERQKQAYDYFANHDGSTIAEGVDNLKISYDEFAKTVQELNDKGLIFRSVDDRYKVV